MKKVRNILLQIYKNRLKTIIKYLIKSFVQNITGIKIYNLEKIELEHIPEETKKSFQHEINGVLSSTRPYTYFVNHSFFKDILPTVENYIGTENSCAFIELAIYSIFCKYDFNVYFSCLQQFWTSNDTKEIILDDEKLEKITVLSSIIKASFEWDNKLHDNSRIKYTYCYGYEFIRQNTKEIVFPNEYYFKDKLYHTNYTEGNSIIPKMVLNDMINTYILFFSEHDNYPYTTMAKSLEKLCSDNNYMPNPITSQYITKYKNNPLAFIYLVALTKANGDFKIDNKAVCKKLPENYINAFRNLFWLCDKYYEYELNSLYTNRANIKTLTQCIKIYNEEYELEEGKHIQESPDNNYLHYSEHFCSVHAALESKRNYPLNKKFKMDDFIIERWKIKLLCEFYVIPELLSDCDSSDLTDIVNIFVGNTTTRTTDRKYTLKKKKKKAFSHFIKYIYKDCEMNIEAWGYFNDYFEYYDNSKNKKVSIYEIDKNPTSNANNKDRDKEYKKIEKVISDNTDT